MLQRPLTCSGCPLHDSNLAMGFSRPEGTGSLGVMIMAEALGESEARDGLPLRPYAESGSILERALRRLGYDREQFVLTNTIQCRPPGNKLEGEWYEHEAIRHCGVHRAEVQRQYRPRSIVALGNTPLRTLTGLVGRGRSISSVRGFILPGLDGTPVVPSFHPAYIGRGAKNLLGVLMRDIELAVQVAKEGGVDRGETNYVEHSDPRSAADYLGLLRGLHRGGGSPESLALAYDIETSETGKEDEADATSSGASRPTQIQFSHRPREAHIFPWREPFISVAKEILALPCPKLTWNGYNFDDPRLEREGVVINGERLDLMWGWHHLQADLPRNLQFAASFYAPEMPPWKHLGTGDQQYGGSDVDSLQRIWLRLPDDLRRAGALESFRRYVVNFYPVLRRMAERGLPIDLGAREQLREEVERRRADVFAEIQRIVPLEVRGIHPKAGYKVNPPEVRLLAATRGLVLAGKKRPDAIPKEFKSEVCSSLGFKCRVFDGQERFYKELDFLPSSPQQMLAYIRWKGYRVPVKLKEYKEDGSQKETTEKKELLRLAQTTKDDFFLKVLEYRELQKIASTYIDGWRLGPDGRIHTTYTFAPATGQLSSRDPNVQNPIKGGALGKAFRRTIRARDGYKLVEIDWTAFHALTLGFCARDPDYMRLARLDIHSYVAGHLLRLPGRDAWLQLPTLGLAAALEQVKRDHQDVRNRKAKPTILGYGFGLGAKKLYDMNVESFSSKAEAQKLIDLINSLFPRTAAFREEVKELASKQCYLRSPHGFVRRFWDVYSFRQVKEGYEPKFGEKLFSREGKVWKRQSGDEGEAAIAFLPASSAFGHVRDVMIHISEMGWDEKYGLINQVHDSLLFECPDALVDDCVRDCSGAMEMASAVLVDPDVAPSGLRCGVEASVGQDWASLKTVYKTPIEVLM